MLYLYQRIITAIKKEMDYMKKTRNAFSIVLSIVMVLSVISVFGVTTSAANTPFKPYDFKIENGTISMKIDSESNSDTRSNSYYFECCRFDLFMIASDSPTGLDPASNKDYNYVIVVRNDGYPTATDGAGVTKDGLTFSITLNNSAISKIRDFSAENPYVWLVIRPCSLANGLDNAFDENPNSMGFYHNKAASCAYFDSAICLGKYNTLDDFHEVKPASTLTIGDFNRKTKTFCDAEGMGTDKFGCAAIYVGSEISDGDTITLPAGYSKSSNSDDYKIYVNLSEPATAEEIAENLISKIKFEFKEEQNIRVELLANEPDEAYFYCEENDHYYTFIDNDDCTWTEAYDAARNMQYNGRQGYLATITSKTEDTFIYEASGGKVGWLGSSRLMPSDKEGNYYNSFSTTAFTDNWCWSCGPEIGTEFFDTKTVRNSSYYTDSNTPVIFARNAEKDYYFNWDKENGEPSASHGYENSLATLMVGSGYTTGSEINNYSWNDVAYDAFDVKGSRWCPKGYMVEFGDLTVGDSNTAVNPSDDGLVTTWVNVTNVEYEPAKSNVNTYEVTINGRPNMVQFIECDHGDGKGTRSFDRYHDSVTIVSYDKNGNVVSSTSKDLAYEIWTITTPLAEGNIDVRVKEAGSPYWEDVSDAYSFVNEYAELDSGVISATLAKTNGAKGAVKVAVVTGAEVQTVQLKNDRGETFTIGKSKAAANADGTLTFNGSVYFHGADGHTDVATIRVLDEYGWHDSDITVQYTIGDRALPR